MAKFFVEMPRAYGGYDPNVVSDASGLKCEDPSRAIQSQKDEADINVIVRNFGITGRMPESIRVPTYGDFDYVGDYRTVVEAVRLAEQSFMAVPADIRLRFENNPQRFLEFCADPGNLEEMRKMGLAKPAHLPDPPIPDPVDN